MEKEQDNTKETSLIRSVLNSETKFVLGIIVFVFGVAAPYFGIKQDIALIKNDVSNINSNHEVHIQDILQSMKDMQATQNSQQAQIIELQKQVIVILNKK